MPASLFRWSDAGLSWLCSERRAVDEGGPGVHGGILNPTLTAPDTGAYVNLADAQQLFKEQLPVALQTKFDASQYAASFDVYGTPGTNLDQLADRINAQVSGVKAQRPTKIIKALVAGGALFTEITTAAALLALVIGGLAVVNTMIMAVSERVREIGLKKAVGATTRRVMREFMLESSFIGMVGGVVGFGFGFAVTALINASLPASQGAIFLVTPGLATLALGSRSAGHRRRHHPRAPRVAARPRDRPACQLNKERTQ